MSLQQKVVSGLRWTAGARVLSQCVNWLGTIYVIRVLSPDDYGLIAIGGFFILYLLLISEGGLSDVLVRERQPDHDLLREFQGIFLLINGASCALLAASSPLVAAYFDEPRLRQILPVLAVQFLIVSFGIIPQATLSREMRFQALSSLQVVQAVFVTIITVVLAFAGAGVWSLVVSNLAGLLLRSIVLNAITREFHFPKFRFGRVRVFAGFSGYVLLDRTVWHVLANIDSLLIGKLLGTTATGQYSVAQNLASIPISKVVGVLAGVAMPAFSQIKEDRKRVQDSYAMAMRNIAIFVFPVGFGLAAIAGPFIDLVLGPKWASIKVIFEILAFSIPFRLFSSFDSPLLLALGLPHVLLQNRVISLVILVSSLLVGSRWGLSGIAVGWAVASPIIWLVATVRFCRKLDWPAKVPLGVAISPFIAASVMYFLVQLINRAVEHSHPSPLIALITAIPVGAIAYASVLWLLARTSFNEAVMMMKALLLGRRSI